MNLGDGSGVALKPGSRANMVDVRMRVNDRIDRRAETTKSRANHLEVAAGVDDDGSLRRRVKPDRTIATERADSEGLDLHVSPLLRVRVIHRLGDLSSHTAR